MTDEKREFYRNLMKISIPITIQYFLGSSLNLIDTIMVGQLGDSAIAAIGIANQVFSLLNLFLLGISGGCSMFISQFYGKEDFSGIKDIIKISLIIGVLITALFYITVLSIPYKLLNLFTQDIEVLILGAEYFRVVCHSYIITTVTVIMATGCRSIEKVKLPMYASIVAICMNTLGNYLFIFGNGVFPELGVRGAALATLIARTVEILILLVGVYRKRYPIILKVNELLSFSISLFKRLIHQSTLLVIKDVIFGLGMTIYIAIYARIGTETLAAYNIVNTIQNFGFVFLAGIGHASVIMIGKRLGLKEFELAYGYAKTFQKLSLMIGTVLGLFLFFSRFFILQFFNLSEMAIYYADTLLIIQAFVFVFLGYNMITVTGILRSGADTGFCLKMDTFAIWVLGIPLALYTGVVLKLPITWIVAINSIKDVYKTVHLLWRVQSKKWLKSVV